MIREKNLIDSIYVLLKEKAKIFEEISSIVSKQNHWIDNENINEFFNSIDTKQRKIDQTTIISKQIEVRMNELKKTYNYGKLENEIAFINEENNKLNNFAKKIFKREQEVTGNALQKKNYYKKEVSDIQVKRKVNIAYKSKKVQKDGYFVDSYK